MVGRTYIVRFKDKTIRAWTYEMPDRALEQFQVAVGNDRPYFLVFLSFGRTTFYVISQ